VVLGLVMAMAAAHVLGAGTDAVSVWLQVILAELGLFR